MLPTRHHVFALLVFPRDHLKFNAGVSHSVVSARKTLKKHIARYIKHTLCPVKGKNGIMTRVLREKDYTLSISALKINVWMKLCILVESVTLSYRLLPFKALVENLIWWKKTCFVGQLVHPRVFYTDMVKILWDGARQRLKVISVLWGCINLLPAVSFDIKMTQDGKHTKLTISGVHDRCQVSGFQRSDLFTETLDVENHGRIISGELNH